MYVRMSRKSGRRRRRTRKRGSRRPFVEHTAGFVLVNETLDKVLMITTPDGYYGFPKGHVERTDRGDLLATAIRETAEETGVNVKPGQVVEGFRHLAVMNFVRKKSYGRDRPAGPIRKDIHLFMAVIPEGTRVKLQEKEVGSYAWLPLEGIEETLEENLMHKHPHARRRSASKRSASKRSASKKQNLNQNRRGPHTALRRRNRLFTDVARAARRFLRDKT